MLQFIPVVLMFYSKVWCTTIVYVYGAYSDVILPVFQVRRIVYDIDCKP